MSQKRRKQPTFILDENPVMQEYQDQPMSSHHSMQSSNNARKERPFTSQQQMFHLDGQQNMQHPYAEGLQSQKAHSKQQFFSNLPMSPQQNSIQSKKFETISDLVSNRSLDQNIDYASKLIASEVRNDDLARNRMAEIKAKLNQVVAQKTSTDLDLSAANPNQHDAFKFLESLSYRIQLSKLYEVVSSCNYSLTNKWCPVILKIGSSLNKEDRIKARINNDYLLQVWSTKGELVFERFVAQPVRAWGIFGDVFIFQEQEMCDEIYLLHLHENRTSDMFRIVLGFDQPDKRWMRTVDKVKLESKIEECRIAYVDNYLFLGTEDRIFYLPIDLNDLTEKAQKARNFSQTKENRRNSAEINIALKESSIFAFKDPKNQQTWRLLREEVCLDYKENEFVTLVPFQRIFQLNLNNTFFHFRGFLQLRQGKVAMLVEQNMYEDQTDEDRDPIKVLQSSLCCLNSQKEVEIFEDQGEKLEAKHNKIVHFLQIDSISSAEVDGKLRPDIDLRSLGTKGRKVDSLTISDSSMTDIRSINMEGQDEEELNYNQTVILRRDGTAELYYNFTLVDWTGKWKPKKGLNFISKIECNFKQFVIQFVEDPSFASDLVDVAPRTENYKIELSAKNLIGENFLKWVDTEKHENATELFAKTLHVRIGDYVKLYASFLTFESFVLVAHRHFVSIYSFIEQDWQRHWIYEDTVRFISTDKEIQLMSSATEFEELLKQQEQAQLELILQQKTANSLATGFHNRTNSLQDDQKVISLRTKQNQLKKKLEKLEQRKLNQAFELTLQKQQQVIVTISGANQVEFFQIDKSGDNLDPESDQINKAKIQNISVMDDFFGRIVRCCSNTEVIEGIFLVMSHLDDEDILNQKQAQKKANLMTRGDKNRFNTFECHENQITYEPSDSHLSQLFFCHQESVFQVSTLDVTTDEFEPTLVTPTTQIEIFNGYTRETLHASKMSSEPIPRNSINHQPMMFLFDPVARQAKIARLYQNSSATDSKINQNGSSCNAYYFRSDDIQTLEFAPKLWTNQRKEIEKEYLNDEKLVSVFSCFDPDTYGSYQFSLVVVLTASIFVFNKTGQVLKRMQNTSIQEAHCIDETYMYCLSNQVSKEVAIFNFADMKLNEVKNTKEHSGLFMYDLYQLVCQDRLEVYKLQSALVGSNDALALCMNSARVGFVKDYHNLCMMPLVHRNTIRFLGMLHRQHYLILREHQGLLTGMTRAGELISWSVKTGKIVYRNIEEEKPNFEYKDFVIYQADEQDLSQLSGFYNFQNETYSLIRSVTWPKDQQANSGSQSRSVSIAAKMRAADQIFEKSVIERDLPPATLQERSELMETQTLQDLNELVDDKNMSPFASKTSQGKQIIHVDKVSRTKDYIFKVLRMVTNNQIRDHDAERESSKSKVTISNNRSNRHQMVQPEMPSNNQSQDSLKVKVDEVMSFKFPLFLPEKKFEVSKENVLFDKNKKSRIKQKIGQKLQQRIYLSQNQNRLLEVVNNTSANFYTARRLPFKNTKFGTISTQTGKNVSHEFIYRGRISAYPQNLQGKCSLPFVFSPNFDMYIDADYGTKHFVIRKTPIEFSLNSSECGDTYEKDSKPFLIIPTDLIKMTLGKVDTLQKIRLMASRMAFMDDDHLRIVTDSGFDSLFQLKNNKMTNQVELVLQSYTRVDNYFREDPENRHVFLQPKFIDPRNVLHRLMRRCKEHIVGQDLGQYCGQGSFHWAPIEGGKKIYAVDYTMSDSMCDGSEPNFLSTEFSFTLMDWIVLRRVFDEPTFDVTQVDGEQLLQVCFNIFPFGNTALHLIDNATINDKFDPVLTARVLFEQLQDGLAQRNIAPGEYEMPIIQNFERKNVLDLVLGLQYKSSDEEQSKDIELSLAALIFQQIKDYKFMNFSKDLGPAVIKAIQMDVVQISDFVQSRLSQVDSSEISNFQLPVNDKFKDTHDGNDEQYGALKASIVGQTKDIQSRMFSSDRNLAARKMKIERFDLYELCQLDIMGFDFLNALVENAQVNPSLELFKQRAVQKLINYFWRQTFFLVGIMMLFPHLLILVVFQAWSKQVVQEKFNEGDWKNIYLSFTLEATLIFLSMIFLLAETIQMKREGWQYFTQVINYIDMIPIILVILVVMWSALLSAFNKIFGNVEIPDSLFFRLIALAALFLWLKFVLFLRANYQFAYIVNMLLELTQLGPFIMVTVISIFGFSNAFNAIAQAKAQEGKEFFIEEFSQAVSFTFLATLGAWEGDDIDMLDGVGWIIFVMMVTVNLLVLLNFVIAIISEIYADVRDQKVENCYFAKAKLILDVLTPFYDQDMMPKMFQSPKNSVIYFATEYTSKRIEEQTEMRKESDKDQNQKETRQKIVEIKQIVTHFTQDLKRDQIKYEIQKQKEYSNKQKLLREQAKNAAAQNQAPTDFLAVLDQESLDQEEISDLLKVFESVKNEVNRINSMVTQVGSKENYLKNQVQMRSIALQQKLDEFEKIGFVQDQSFKSDKDSDDINDFREQEEGEKVYAEQIDKQDSEEERFTKEVLQKPRFSITYQ